MKEYFVYSDESEMTAFVSKDELQSTIDHWVSTHGIDPHDVYIYKTVKFTYTPPVSSLVID